MRTRGVEYINITCLYNNRNFDLLSPIIKGVRVKKDKHNMDQLIFPNSIAIMDEIIENVNKMATIFSNNYKKFSNSGQIEINNNHIQRLSSSRSFQPGWSRDYD